MLDAQAHGINRFVPTVLESIAYQLDGAMPHTPRLPLNTLTAFRSVAELEKAIVDYITHHNRQPKPFVWTASADLILAKTTSIYKRTSGTPH